MIVAIRFETYNRAGAILFKVTVEVRREEDSGDAVSGYRKSCAARCERRPLVVFHG